MKKSLKWFFVVALMSFLIHSLGIFYTTPENQTAFSNCRYIDSNLDLIGSEDSVFYTNDILIGIHSNMHKIFKSQLPLEQVEKGGFYAVYGIANGNFVTKKVEVKNYPKEIFFIPHGIYLRGKNHLHVINHSFYSGGERVETYLITKTVQGDVILEFLHSTAMESQFNGITNDIVFLSQERFIITHWQLFTIPMTGNKDQSIWKTVVAMIVNLLKIKTTNMWDCKYITGGIASCIKVPSSDGAMINGIAYDGTDILAVTDTIDRTIKIFKLSVKREIELIQTIATTMLPDNISYDHFNKQFIVGGTNTSIEYLTLNSKLQRVQENKSDKSVVEYQGIIETIKLNNTSKVYENTVLFSSSKAVVGLSGALIDQSQKFLFINSFADKSLVFCTKTN